jgi:hypothetical protein
VSYSACQVGPKCILLVSVAVRRSMLLQAGLRSFIERYEFSNATMSQLVTALLGPLAAAPIDPPLDPVSSGLCSDACLISLGAMSPLIRVQVVRRWWTPRYFYATAQ